jgi:diguanylate cyclase (GGDEF)-like protein
MVNRWRLFPGRWLSAKTIQTKIVLIVAVFAVFATGTGLLSLARLREVQRGGDQVFNEAMTPALKLADIRLLILGKRNYALRHASAPDLPGKKRWEDAFRAQATSLLEDLRRFPVTKGAADENRIEQLTALTNAYDEIIYDEYLPASRRDDRVALQQLRDRTSPIVDTSEKILDEMIAEQNARVGRIHRHLESVYGTSRTVVTLVLLIGLVLELSLARYIALLIVRPLQRVQWVATGLAEGDLNRCAQIDSGDEVGRLALALDQAVEIRRNLETELMARNAELDRLAKTDALTELHNRRSLQERLAEFTSLASRHGHDFALMIIDIDLFKRVNDTRGHEVGDAVLREVAHQLNTIARLEDVAGRWGGEEFLILMPDTDQAGASVLAERLRAQIATHQIDVDNAPPLSVTVSIGVAAGLADGPTGLVRRADEALYAAKQQGRNRVTCAAAPDVPYASTPSADEASTFIGLGTPP